MSQNLRRQPSAQPRRAVAHKLRLVSTAVLSLGLLSTTGGCGMNVQTTNPYTPAIGVNFDAGDIQIRDLIIVSRAKGSGFLAATFTGNGQDSLISLGGTATKSDGSDGAPLVFAMKGPVAIGTTKPVVLTDRPLITVTSADLQPGLTARMVLRFKKAGETTTNAPVVDGTLPQYRTISPTPSAPASP